jgi:hypothetical protein
VVATETAIFAAGWTLDAGGDAAAVVEAFPMDGPDLAWSLGASTDDRAFGIDVSAEGIAVTGHTGDTPATRDLFVVWLDPDLVEGDRVVFDGAGNGPDGGNDIVMDGDTVVVAGYTQGAAMNDLLVQRWTRPE